MAVVIVLGEKISQGSLEKLTAGGTPTSLIWRTHPESATVTELYGKPYRWNEVNPASEKPKLW